MGFGDLLVKIVEEKTKEKADSIQETAKSISEIGIKEYAQNEIEKIEKSEATILSKLDSIKGMSPEQLTEQLRENLSQLQENIHNHDGVDESAEGLSDEEKTKIKEETGWSDEIVDAIGSWKEYEIYKNAGLVEAEIGGRKCLIRTDIDWDKKWDTGKFDENGNPIYETNRDRVSHGKPPLDDNGKPIVLHHIGQHANSPLAELTFEEHRCGGNDTILHDKSKETEVHGAGNTWDTERSHYWEDRADYSNGGNGNV